MIGEYRDQNPDCEWVKYLGIDFAIYAAPDDLRRKMRPEVNHIFTNPRRDLWPIFCTLSKINHDRFHEDTVEGRILCMLVKCIKGEADPELWGRAFGSDSKPIDIIGWVETVPIVNASDGIEWCRRWLLHELRKLERKAA